jgi:hypothetical protein
VGTGKKITGDAKRLPGAQDCDVAFYFEMEAAVEHSDVWWTQCFGTGFRRWLGYETPFR